MPTQPIPGGPAANDDRAANPAPPHPAADEPGPRDVPDEQVIDKTLPARRSGDVASGGTDGEPDR